MQTSIRSLMGLPIKLSLFTVMSLFAFMALPVQSSDAQVVPYRVEGTGFGSLLDLSSFGEARGLHLGSFTYVGNNQGVTTQFLPDGSTLRLERQRVIFIETSDPDENGLVVTTLVEETQILDGTRRFRNVKPVEDNLITSVVSEPYDPNGDLTAIPFFFETVGQIDLGRRR